MTKTVSLLLMLLASTAAAQSPDSPRLGQWYGSQDRNSGLVPDVTLGIDQQQPIIDTNAGFVFAIGGYDSTQKLAQVVTAGLSGFLRTVRLPVSCDGSDLLLQVQRVTAGVPNGVVLASQTIPGATLPPSELFKDLSFSTPAFLRIGEQFAIVLTSAGSCGIYPGPVGDSYPSGNLYFDSLPNPPGWVCVCDFPDARFDLPFQTLVEAVVPEKSVTGDLDGNCQGELVIDFGPSFGIWVWQNNTRWVQLHGLSPEDMVIGDLDGNGRDDAIIDFGPAFGIWVWENNADWRLLPELTP